MTLETFIRAQLAAFAYQQAGATGSIASMKAICYAMANRVKAGWGGWADVIEAAPESAAHDDGPPAPISLRNPALQGLLREIEEIYAGSAEDDTRQVVGECLFWQVLTRPDVRPWFRDNIVRDPENHPRRAHVGTIILYE